MSEKCDGCGAGISDQLKNCDHCDKPTPWRKEIPAPLTYTRLSQMKQMGLLEFEEYFNVDAYSCDQCGRGDDFEIAHVYFGEESGKVRALTCFYCGEPNSELQAQLEKLEQ